MAADLTVTAFNAASRVLGLLRIVSGLAVVVGIAMVVMTSPFGDPGRSRSPVTAGSTTQFVTAEAASVTPPTIVFYLIESQRQSDEIHLSEITIYEANAGSSVPTPSRNFDVFFARTLAEEQAAKAEMLRIVMTKGRGSVISIEDVRENPPETSSQTAH